MAVTVCFSSPLLKTTDNNSEINVEGGTIKEINKIICDRFPKIHSVIYDSKGELSKVINIYVNDDDIRTLDGEDTLVSSGDEISFIPTISGG